MRKLIAHLPSVALLLFTAGLWSGLESGCTSKTEDAYNMANDTTLSLVVREWSKRINKYPDDPEYYIERSKELVDDKKHALALNDVDKAIDLNGDQPSYYELKGVIQMALNETFNASETYELAAQKFPKDASTHLNLGRFHYIVRAFDESEQALKKAIELDATRPDAFFLIGLVSKERGDTTEAISAFERAYLIDNEHIDAMIQLGQLYSEQGDSTGLEWYSKAIAVDEYNDEAYYGKGYLLQHLGLFERAIQNYQDCIDVNARHYLAYFNTGYILFSGKNWDRALEHFRIAVKFAPDFVKGHYMLGLTNEGKSNFEQARVHYNKCLQLDPDYDLAKLGLERLENNS